MDEYWVEQADGSLAPESALLQMREQEKVHPFHSKGKNVQIAPTVFFAHPELVDIGDNVRIDGFCSFTSAMSIGNFVHIGPFVSVIGGKNSKLIMGEFSGLSAGCRVICGSDDYFESLSNPTIPLMFRPLCTQGFVLLSRHCIAGTNTVIHPNIRFNTGVCTGSCTLVTHDLMEEWMVYKGIPAIPYKKRNSDKIQSDERKFMMWQANR